jgi:hypothetical protein
LKFTDLFFTLLTSRNLVMVNIEHEIEQLKEEIKRLGKQNEKGQFQVSFGVIVMDDRCSNIFEALVGTLRAAKVQIFD